MGIIVQSVAQNLFSFKLTIKMKYSLKGAVAASGSMVLPINFSVQNDIHNLAKKVGICQKKPLDYQKNV